MSSERGNVSIRSDGKILPSGIYHVEWLDDQTVRLTALPLPVPTIPVCNEKCVYTKQNGWAYDPGCPVHVMVRSLR